jgi:hypothetical protein
MSATDSERTRKRGRVHLGISGRIPSERVADLRRNQWPDWVGIRTEYRFFYAALVGQRFIILHAIQKKRQKLRERDIALAEQRYEEVKQRSHDENA